MLLKSVYFLATEIRLKYQGIMYNEVLFPAGWAQIGLC